MDSASRVLIPAPTATRQVLEAHFPRSDDVQTREMFSEEQHRIRFEYKEIERGFILAMTLQNEIDVGWCLGLEYTAMDWPIGK